MRSKNPLISIYWESTLPLRFLTIPVSILASIGLFLRSSSPGQDMLLIFSIAPWFVWSAILLSSSVFRLHGLLYPIKRCARDEPCLSSHTIISILFKVLNIFVWSVLFVSSAMVANFGLGLLLLIPCMIEVWLLSRSIEAYNACCNIQRERKNA